MINPDESLSIVRQCQLLDLHRFGVYYQPAKESDTNLELMRLIDRIHIARLFLGMRRITDVFREMGYRVNRKRVRQLMISVFVRKKPVRDWLKALDRNDCRVIGADMTTVKYGCVNLWNLS